MLSKGPHVKALDPQERPVPDDPCLTAVGDELRGRHALIAVQRCQELGVTRAFGRHIGGVLESRSPVGFWRTIGRPPIPCDWAVPLPGSAGDEAHDDMSAANDGFVSAYPEKWVDSEPRTWTQMERRMQNR